MTEFQGAVPALAQALSERGYTVLTPVQEAVLAPEVAAADLLVSAQTGSGKTVAFGLSLAPALLDGAERFPAAEMPAKPPLALVVAPTRELALQVKRELEWLYQKTGAAIASCVGGMDMRTERRALQRGAQIVVGTPGRLRDHIERHSLDMTGLRAVVLDEADEMLDLGFRDDLEYILGAAPKQRRTLMFSATVPRTIATLAKRFQRDAVRLATQGEQSQHVDIEYRALTVAANDRENAIINVLRYFEAQNALVFCGTRAAVNHMTARFNNRGFSVVALSGELSQHERTQALQAMRNGRARVCIATDVAARGLDLPNLDLVIHADLPRNREGLLHRSGRTGRAGRKGVSVLVVPHNWRKRTERLLQSANVEATWARPPTVLEIMQRDDERILDDPDLSEPIHEDEEVFAQQLLERHGPQQVAAALVRRFRAGRSAPEEILDAAPNEEKGNRRDDFKDGVWFTLSTGHQQNAEPRWLLPMLCRFGNITKRDIGAIKINQTDTYVELAPGCIDRFLEGVGPSLTLEKTITVTRLAAMPDGVRQRGEKPYGKKKAYAARHDAHGGHGGHATTAPRRIIELEPDRAPAGKGMQDAGPQADGRKDKKTWADKPKTEIARADKPADIGADQKPHFEKPRDEKPQGDKPRDEKPRNDGPKDGKTRAEKTREEKPRHEKPRDKTLWAKKSEDKKPHGIKPWEKPKGKKLNKKAKLAKLVLKATAKKGPKSHGPAKPGSGPVKRVRPQ
ncbi:MAG: DEAD/DEAH box helicase [Alphaproteobacteria bacterium]|nr:DEAD/DEAH box helicase [Alphaproteobacteria bacterium]